VVYGTVAVAALSTVGAPTLAASTAPLRTVVDHTSWSAFAPVVRIGAAIACAGVLLSLLAGISRTVFAMAANGELPRPLARVHARHRVPHVAEITIGVIVATITATADLRGAIGFSSFAVLVYYAIANASAITLRGSRRHAALASFGLAGCMVLALALPRGSVVAGAAVLGLGALVYGAIVRAHGPV